MNGAAALLFLAASTLFLPGQAPQPAFTRFLFCHDFTRGAYETQCVELNPDGSGMVRYKPRDATRETEEVQIGLTLSKPSLDRFVAALVRTRFLADGARYESSKKVADLGMKRLAVDTSAGRREAAFNYSDLKEVRDLIEFLDNLVAQEITLFSLDAAVKYQRLSIPEKLERLASAIDTNRIADHERVAAALEKVQADTRILDSARELARQLRKRVLKK